MRNDILLVKKAYNGELESVGFKSVAEVVEHHFTYLHIGNPEDQLEWLNKLQSTILPEAIKAFKLDFSIDLDD